MVTEEGRQSDRGRLAPLIKDVGGKQPRQPVGRDVPGDHVGHRRLKAEVQHGRIAVDPCVAGQLGRIDVIDLAEDMEVGDAVGPGTGLHGRDERLPELRIDVLGRVDAESVDPIAVDPAPEDLDHARDDAGMPGHQVVEAREIAVRGAFVPERRVAPVMVVDRVVQPGRDLYRLLSLGDIGGVGIVGPGQPFEVRPVETLIDGFAVRAAASCVGIVGPAAVGAVVLRTLAIADHVGRMVGDDVHIDLDAARVGRLDQCSHGRVIAEMGIDPGEIRDPVAVGAGELAPRLTLNRLVLEDRGHPDRRRPKALDVVEPFDYARQVAAVIEPLVCRIETVLQPPARNAAGVVVRIAVGEPVRQQEIDHLVLRQTRAIVIFGALGHRLSTGHEERSGQSRHEAAFSCAHRALLSSLWPQTTWRAVSLQDFAVLPRRVNGATIAR